MKNKIMMVIGIVVIGLGGFYFLNKNIWMLEPCS